MKTHRCNPKRKKFVFSCLFFAIVVGLSLFFNLCYCKLHNVLFISNTNNFQSLIMSTFGIEGSVTALSISVIAIITGLFKETKYGIKLTTFTMYLEHEYIDSRAIVVECLMLLIVNYFYIAKSMYPSAIFVFFVSIILTVFLFLDLSSPFVNSEKFELKVKEYVVLNFLIYEDYNLVRNIYYEIVNSVNEKDIITIKRDLDLYNDCLSSDYIEKWNKDHYSSWSDSYKSSIEYLISNNYINESIYSIKNVIGTCYRKKLYDIFYVNYNLLRNYVNYIKSIQNDVDFGKIGIVGFVNDLLKLSIGQNTIEDNKSIPIFISSTTYAILQSNVNYNTKKDTIREMLLDVDCYLSNTNEKGNTLLTNCKISIYKVLLDYNLSLLKEFKTILSPLDTNENGRIYTQIMIYLYYLVYREDDKLVNKDKKEQYKLEIKELSFSISNLYYITDNIKKLYSPILDSISSWEIYNDNEGKFIIMGNVVRDFFIFSLIATRRVKNSLESIKYIFNKSEIFNIVNTYFSKDSASDTFNNSFKNFMKMFLDNTDNIVEAYKGEINLFKDTLIGLYKNAEIAETLPDDKEIENNIKLLSQNLINAIDASELIKDISDNNYCNSSHTEIEILTIPTYKFAFTNNYIMHDNELVDVNVILSMILKAIIQKLKNSMLIQHIQFQDENKLNLIFSLIEDLKHNGTKITTLIDGWQKNEFSMYDETQQNIKRYKEIAKNLGDSFISSPQFGTWIGFDQNNVHMHVGKINVIYRSINTKEMDELLDPIPNTDQVYLTITNDIKAKFTREEAYKYLTAKRIVIEIYSSIFVSEPENKNVGFLLQTDL